MQNVPPFGPRPCDVSRGVGLDLPEPGGDGATIGGEVGFRGLAAGCSDHIAGYKI